MPRTESVFHPHVLSPLPDDHELVEFLGLPLHENYINAVCKRDIRPYNARFSDGSKSRQLTLGFSRLEKDIYVWSPSYIHNLERILRDKYRSSTVANKVYKNILDWAKSYLEYEVPTKWKSKFI